MKRIKSGFQSGRASALPPLSRVDFRNTSRLIPSKYSVPDESVLAGIAPTEDVLATAFELDDKTNDRLLAEQELLPGIGPHELVFGVPYATIINAAFTHARPDGSRFNGPDRGAWYAGKTIRTAQAEVAFHQSMALSEVGIFEDEITYDEYLADFSGEFHDIRHAAQFRNCVDPGSYAASQLLAERLLAQSSLGIVYPSVRLPGGECIVCFRPALVANVRKHKTYRFRWEGEPKAVIEIVHRL